MKAEFIRFARAQGIRMVAVACGVLRHAGTGNSARLLLWATDGALLAEKSLCVCRAGTGAIDAPACVACILRGDRFYSVRYWCLPEIRFSARLCGGA